MLHTGTGSVGDPAVDDLVFRYSALSFTPTPARCLGTQEQSASGEQTEDSLAMFAQHQVQKGTISLPR